MSCRMGFALLEWHVTLARGSSRYHGVSAHINDSVFRRLSQDKGRQHVTTSPVDLVTRSAHTDLDESKSAQNDTMLKLRHYSHSFALAKVGYSKWNNFGHTIRGSSIFDADVWTCQIFFVRAVNLRCVFGQIGSQNWKTFNVSFVIIMASNRKIWAVGRPPTGATSSPVCFVIRKAALFLRFTTASRYEMQFIEATNAISTDHSLEFSNVYLGQYLDGGLPGKTESRNLPATHATADVRSGVKQYKFFFLARVYAPDFISAVVSYKH